MAKIDKIHVMNRCLSIFLLYLLPALAWGQAAKFEVDELLQTNARKWANEFVTFANDKYAVDLDFSHQSIKYLDDIVEDLHKIYVAENPADELIVPIARALGCYVAEVYRTFNGGDWGWVTLEDGTYPSVQTKSGAPVLPMAKALDQIKTRTGPDIWEYYQLLSGQ